MGKTTIVSTAKGNRIINSYIIDSFTNVGCSGSIVGPIYLDLFANGLIQIHGRIVINSFVRNAGNPGFTFDLPSDLPMNTINHHYVLGTSSINTLEAAVLDTTANSRQVRVITTETYANASNGTLVFHIHGLINLFEN